MFSIVIPNVSLSFSGEMIREKFEQLGFGEFTVVTKLSNDKMKVFINYTSMTEESKAFRYRLIENDLARKAEQLYDPVKIFYDQVGGRERYWKIYLTKTPAELVAERERMIAEQDKKFKVYLNLSKGGRL